MLEALSAPGLLAAVALVACGTAIVLLAYRLIPSRASIVCGLLERWHPSVIHELLRRRRRFFWYKTSRSLHDQSVWGYVDTHSIAPGAAFRLMLSVGPRSEPIGGRAEVFRIGDYGDEDRLRVWRSDRMTVGAHGSGGNTAASLGPNWPAALTLDETAGWSSGYYSIDFVLDSGVRDTDIAFLVVTDPQAGGDVLVKLSTATYQAYNRWGGHSLYDLETPSTYEGKALAPFEGDPLSNQGHMVSFDRPTRSEFFEWEYYFVRWLERLAREEGFTVAYASNFDLTRDPSIGDRYPLLISVGHDEYWSGEEFDRTYDRIFKRGLNTLFLGSNAAYWQVRYVDANGFADDNLGRQLICYKSLVDPIRTRRPGPDESVHATARFREDARCPETMLMGVGYQSNLNYRHQTTPAYSYEVVTTELPFFRGTGYAKGDLIPGVIGHEWDSRDPEIEHPAPREPRVEGASRLWDAKRSRFPRIPLERLTVVFAADVVDVRGHAGRAESVYFESDAGAKVFSAGTNRWAWGLGKPGYTSRSFDMLNKNLVRDFLDRPDRSAPR